MIGIRRYSPLVRWGMRVGVLGAVIVSLAACAVDGRTNEVTVVGTDYAFQVPATLPAGRTLFALENRGRVDHELILARLKPGVTMQQALETQRAGGDADEVMMRAQACSSPTRGRPAPENS